MDKRYRIQESLLGVVLVTLPLTMQLNSLAIILAVVYFFFVSIREKSLGNLKLYWMSFAFFLAQLGSFAFSENQKLAGTRLTLFLSFLLFPIIFSNLNVSGKKRLDNFRLSRWLFYGTLGILIYGLARFLYDIIALDVRYDYGRGVALFLKYVPHHVYLSMFIIISIFGVLKKAIDVQKHRWFLVVIPIFYVALILLSSRTAILISVLILPLVSYFILKEKLRRKKTIRILGFVFLILISAGFLNDFARDKILHTYYELANISTVEKPFAGVSFRKGIWSSSLALIQQSPWIGYGIGDIQTIMDTYYKEHNLERLVYLNAHNQYLQFFLHHGILIGSLLIGCIIGLLRKLIKQKQSFLLFCWFIVLSFSMTESILMRQWGVVLFAFVLNYSIYALNYADTEELST